MRFEALHQRIKRYTKNCGFKNVGKTIAEKFLTRVWLQFSDEMPILRDHIIPKFSANGKLLNIKFFNKTLKKNKNVLVEFDLQLKNKKIGKIMDFKLFQNKIILTIEDLSILRFNTDLLYYEVNETGVFSDLEITEIGKKVGALYTCNNKKYACFSCFLY